MAACATNTPMASLSPGAPASAPLPVANHDWFFDRDQQELTLAYGIANSDDLKLQLVCQTGTGALELAAVFDRPSRVLLLESGGDTERYPARSEPAGIHEGQYVTANAKTKDPVFQRFRSLGWIALWEGDNRDTLVAHPTSKATVERFFAACG